MMCIFKFKLEERAVLEVKCALSIEFRHIFRVAYADGEVIDAVSASHYVRWPSVNSLQKTEL